MRWKVSVAHLTIERFCALALAVVLPPSHSNSRKIPGEFTPAPGKFSLGLGEKTLGKLSRLSANSPKYFPSTCGIPGNLRLLLWEPVKMLLVSGCYFAFFLASMWLKGSETMGRRPIPSLSSFSVLLLLFLSFSLSRGRSGGVWERRIKSFAFFVGVFVCRRQSDYH